MVAARTLVPVLGVPIPATMLNGLDALLSIVQMPKGIPVGTLAIGRPGAANAALLAAQIVALAHPEVRGRLRIWREARRTKCSRRRSTLPARSPFRPRFVRWPPSSRAPRSASSAAGSWAA
jgi:5-(carboxyamino)imidazole ribonucleotide mutase